MTDDVTQGLLRRIQVLERTVVRYRQGVVTDDSPLTVDIGGSGEATLLSQVAGGLAVGDTAALLAVGGDLLALGAIQNTAFLKLLTLGDHKVAWGASGTVGLDNTAGYSKGTKSVTHGLGATPVLVVATPSVSVGITEDGGATPHAVMVGSESLGSTTFTLRFEVNGTSNNSVGAYWLAIA